MRDYISVKLKSGLIIDAYPMVLMGIDLGMYAFDISREEKIHSRVRRVAYVVGCPRLGYRDLYSALRKGCLEGLKLG